MVFVVVFVVVLVVVVDSGGRRKIRCGGRYDGARCAARRGARRRG